MLLFNEQVFIQARQMPHNGRKFKIPEQKISLNQSEKLVGKNEKCCTMIFCLVSLSKKISMGKIICRIEAF